MKLFRSSSKGKVLLSYGTGVLLLIEVFLLALSALQTYRLDTGDLIRSYEFVKKLTDLERRQKDAEISQLGFLLTNKNRYLEPYREADRLIWEEARELQRGTGGPASAATAEYEAALRRKFAYLEESVLRREEGLVEPLQVMFTGAGREASADLEASYEKLLRQLREDLGKTQVAADRAARSAEKLLYQVGALAFGIFSLAMWGIWRDIRRREQYEQELLAARASAVQMSEFKTQFLSIMSHEVRTPLNSIIGVAELLDDTPLNEKQKKYVGTFRRSGDILLNIVNDILDLSKIEAGQMELEFTEVFMQNWLDELQPILQARAQQKNIGLKFVSELSVGCTVKMDANRMRQVLLNLLGNAIKFTDRGEVSLTVRAAAERALEFVIRDTGPGMNAGQIAKLFRPFQQAEVSTARKFGGTGLGLFISKKIVSLAGGDITVVSEPGHGSCFRVYIPAEFGMQNSDEVISVAVGQKTAPEDIPAVKNPNAVDTRGFRGKKILVVDDVADNCQLLEHFLAPLGMNITFGHDGQQAVDLFRGGQFDLILMDMQMPVMNGQEAARKIRQIELATQLPPTVIVALTAQAYPEELNLCLQAGCDIYLSKPFKKNQLFSVIGRALNGGLKI